MFSRPSAKLAWLCVLCWAAAAFGQPAAAPTSGGKPAKINFQTIFDYQQQLGLTQEQADKIRQALTGLSQRTTDLRNKKKIAARALLDMIQKDADLPSIRKGLEVIANFEVQARFDDISTAREVMQMLSEEQRRKWTEIQTRNRALPAPPEKKPEATPTP